MHVGLAATYVRLRVAIAPSVLTPQEEPQRHTKSHVDQWETWDREIRRCTKLREFSPGLFGVVLYHSTHFPLMWSEEC